eukprot:scaffold5353_cov134-Isochrysis_galbana.AAC.3
MGQQQSYRCGCVDRRGQPRTRRRGDAERRRGRSGRCPLSGYRVPCLKNAVNENVVNGRKTCKRDSKEHGQGSRITRTLTKDRRDTLNLDNSALYFSPQELLVRFT